jgi:hypothetical protein
VATPTSENIHLIGRIRQVRVHPDLLASAILLASTLLFFAPYLFGNDSMLPYNLMHRIAPWSVLEQTTVETNMPSDAIILHMPWRTLYREALLRGEMPFWNPYNFSGIPFLANLQSTVLYPANLFFLLGSLSTGFLLFSLFHTFFTGLGAYFLLRQFDLARPAALSGAVAWMFSGMLIFWMMWVSIPATLSWFPWLLLCGERIVTYGRWRDLGFMAITTGLFFLAGHIQFAYYGFLCLASLVAWQLLWSKLAWSERLQRAGFVGLGLSLGFLIALCQIMPTLELVSHNTRSGSTINSLMNSSIPLKQIITVLLPEAYGNGVVFWGKGNSTEFTGYVGLMSTMLASCAVFHPRIKEQKLIWLWLAVALISLHIAHQGSLNYLLAYLPGYTSFRGIQRLLVIWNLAVALLAAWGVEALWLAQGWRKRLLLGGFASLLALATISVLSGANELIEWLLAFSEAPNRELSEPVLRTNLQITLWIGIVGCLIALGLTRLAQIKPKSTKQLVLLLPTLLIFYDGLQLSRAHVPQVDKRFSQIETSGIAWLQEHREEGRIARFGDGILNSPLPANSNILFGLEDINGSDSFTLDRYNKLIGLIDPERYQASAHSNSLGNFRKPEVLQSPLLSLIGTRFLLTPQEITGLSEPWNLVYNGPDMLIYRNEQTLPLAFVVGDLRYARSDQEAEAMLQAPDFDPSRQAVVQEALDTQFDPAARAEVEIVERSLNRLELRLNVQAQAGKYALLLIRQNNYPGWEATVDGQQRAIITSDLSFQGIMVGAGDEQVVLQFRPRHFYLYLCVSLGALLVSLGFIGLRPRLQTKTLQPAKQRSMPYN